MTSTTSHALYRHVGARFWYVWDSSRLSGFASVTVPVPGLWCECVWLKSPWISAV
jgi:hypothetical protein